MTKAVYNFIRGVGSVLDFAPASRPSRVGRGVDLGRSDTESLSRDWQQTAGDFGRAFDQTVGGRGKHVQPQQAKS